MARTIEFKKGYLVIEVHGFKISIRWASKKRLEFIKWCFENNRLDLLDLKDFI